MWSNKVSDRFFIPDLVFGFMIVMNFSMYNTIVEVGKPDEDINITIRPDPNGILSFLVSELDSAEKAGQRAWIFGHIPPGSSDMMRDQVWVFL